MDGAIYIKDSYMCKQYKFTEEFRIERFEESIYPETKSIYFDNDNRNIGVSLTIFGKGWFEKSSDYVTIYIKNFVNRITKTILLFSCILYIMDENGEKKIPRTLGFRFPLWKHETYSERYVGRKLLLRNATEYLPYGVLTIIAEGTLEEWYVPNQYFMDLWTSEHHARTFHLEEDEKGLRVYLLKDSAHSDAITENSRVFQKMWDISMREMPEKRVLLKNEELPAFLCMLLFIETNTLILHRITIFDLYKIAHMYDISILLEECREYIQDIPLKTLTDISDFATYYQDKNLKAFVSEKYPWKSSKGKSDSVIRKYLQDYIVCDTTPSIKGEDTEKYMTNMWKKFLKINSLRDDSYAESAEMAKNDFVIAPRTSENSTSNFEINGRLKDVYSNVDSANVPFLINHSHVFESWLNDGETYPSHLGNEELPAFLSMLCYIQTEKLILYDTTIFDLYKIAYESDIPVLLQQCRRYIQRIPLKAVSDILEFATYYDDKVLIRTANFYLENVRELDPNFQIGNDLDGYFVCDTRSVSNHLINKKEGFENYLRDLWRICNNTSKVTTEDLKHIQISEFETAEEPFDFYR